MKNRKSKRNIKDRRVTITFEDLLPTAGDLWLMAYESLVGDHALPSRGVHQGRKVDRKDTMGLSKTRLYDAALQKNMTVFRDLWSSLVNNPFSLPPSIRTYIPKDEHEPSKGQRPIDDPAEIKRLVMLWVRDTIQKRLEAFLTPGQLGGRPKWAFPKGLPCPRQGATAQDHVAWSIQQAAWLGKPFCLSVDLRDAFGNVPKKLVIQLLTKKLNMSLGAARWIWRLAMIDCINPKASSARRIRKPGKGIEQGGTLSSMLMNLSLAPMIRELERNLGVNVYTYLDDIYIMSTDRETAQRAFSMFNDLATAAGLNNVRELRAPGQEPTDCKASEIVDLRTETVAVLKTFHVSEQAIVPAPGVIEQLVQDGVLACGECTIRELRDLIGQSLSRKLTKDRFPGPLSSPSMRGTTRAVPLSCESGDGGGPATKEDEGVTPMVIVHSSARRDFDLEGAPHMGLPLVRGVHVLPVQGDDLPCDLLTGSSRFPLRVDAPMENENLFLPMEQETLLLGVCGFPPQPVPDQDQEYQDHGVLMEEESLNPTECDRSEVVRLDREQVDPEGQPAPLSILHRDVAEALQTNKPIRLRNRFKGAVLDLTGLDTLGIEEHRIQEVVGALARAVRFKGRARVVLPMFEAWTGLEGWIDRGLYKQSNPEILDDGKCLVKLRVRESRSESASGLRGPRPHAALVVVGFTPARRGSTEAMFHVRGAKGPGRHCVRVSSVNQQAQAADALVRLLDALKPVTVAVLLDGNLSCLRFLANAACEPPHTGLARCFGRLRRGYDWQTSEGYLLGTVQAAA